MQDELKAWRDGERKRLLASRAAVDEAERARQDARVNALLLEAFTPLAGRTIGFYWPMKGECDVRPTAMKLHALGSRLALPAVVRKERPLAYSEWTPQSAMARDAFGVPVPEGGAALVPDVLLVPPVGFDEAGYRLGFGTAYVDRTLAVLEPQPVRVAVGRELSRMPTIRPQPHDIPMDFVVTEAGVHEVTPGGLRRLERAADAATIAERLIEDRRFASATELAKLLNTLLEAERAGAKVLSAFADQMALGPAERGELLRVQRDESHNCAVLMDLLRRLPAEASRATGDFLGKALAVEGARARLEFLNRGQAWVAKRIAATLPRIEDEEIRAALKVMHDSHVDNIAATEALIARLPG
jgi:5,10-methenyltetrahydrofolate synthetase